MKKRTEKTALEKAKSGQLLINESDVSSVVGQNVNLLPKAPMAKEDCDGAEAFTQSFFKAATRVSSKKKGCDHNSNFTFLMLAFLTNKMMDSLAPNTNAHALEYHCH